MLAEQMLQNSFVDSVELAVIDIPVFIGKTYGR